jgi:hypothetical protein
MATPLGTNGLSFAFDFFLIATNACCVVWFLFYLVYFILFIYIVLASMFVHVIIHILDIDLWLHTPRIS